LMADIGQTYNLITFYRNKELDVLPTPDYIFSFGITG